jgi:hypothetical protein
LLALTHPNERYDRIDDVELTSDHLDFLRKAGASEAFLTLIETDPEEADLSRNSAQREVKKYVYSGDLDGDPEEFTHNGGVFFSTIWDGNLYQAYRYKADAFNVVLLKSVFGEARINADRPHPEEPKVSEVDPEGVFIGVHPQVSDKYPSRIE